MGQLLPLQRTTPTQEQFHHAIVEAWNAVLGDRYPCNAMIAAIMFGQFAFETGWGKSCWNWNLGNHRTGPLNPPNPKGWAGDYVELKTADEYIDGKRVIVGGYFRAYGLRDVPNGLRNGALGHVSFLYELKRYANALDVLKATAGIPVSGYATIIAAAEFVEALKRGGYFTGPLDVYRAGVQDIAHKYVRLPFVEGSLAPASPITALDPRDFGLPIPRPEDNYMTAIDALDLIFGEEWDVADRLHLASVLACRYDCEDIAA